MLDRRLTLLELDVEIARAVEQRAIALDLGSFTAYDEQDHKIDRLLAQRALLTRGRREDVMDLDAGTSSRAVGPLTLSNVDSKLAAACISRRCAFEALYEAALRGDASAAEESARIRVQDLTALIDWMLERRHRLQTAAL